VEVNYGLAASTMSTKRSKNSLSLVRFQPPRKQLFFLVFWSDYILNTAFHIRLYILKKILTNWIKFRGQ